MLAATARSTAMGTRALKHVASPTAAWRVTPAGDVDADGPQECRPAWEGPAVAVLPFEVLGDAAEDRWFADGLADDM
jgi:hypothetical protein